MFRTSNFFYISHEAYLIFMAVLGNINRAISNIAGFEPNYRCRVAQCDNSTASYFSEDTGRLPSFLANTSIPLGQRCVVPVTSR